MLALYKLKVLNLGPGRFHYISADKRIRCRKLEHEMKRFASFVLLTTLVCILVTIREAQGQLGFRFPKVRTGRSLRNVSIENLL